MVQSCKKIQLRGRGEGNHGFGKVAWSIPWCSLFYARFGEAELAFKVLANTHKNKTINVNMMGSQGKVLDSCFWLQWRRLLKCFCRAMKVKSIYCLPCRKPGKKETLMVLLLVVVFEIFHEVEKMAS